MREEKQGNLTGMTKTREARHSFRRVQVLGRAWGGKGATWEQNSHSLENRKAGGCVRKPFEVEPRPEA